MPDRHHNKPAGRAAVPSASPLIDTLGERLPLDARLQILTTDLLGAEASAWQSDATTYHDALAHEVEGMLRSRANTIEGGTSEVNRNILGERVLGLPREPDPWNGVPWRDVPRS